MQITALNQRGDISNNIFEGGGVQIPKNISYNVKMRNVIVCKALLHQMIACPF